MSREGTGRVELREAGGKVHLTVYPCVTDVFYDMGSYEEIVRGGAFGRTLSEDPDVILNLEHRGLALASTRPVKGAPTLKLAEDSTGLRGAADLSPDDPDARLLKVKAEQAPLESSFAFRVNRQVWDEAYEKREILEVGLHRGDISIVGRAASPATQGLVDIRGRAGDLEQRRRNADMLGNRFVGGILLGAAETPALRRRSGGLASSYIGIARARRAAALAGMPDKPRRPRAADRITK